MGRDVVIGTCPELSDAAAHLAMAAADIFYREMADVPPGCFVWNDPSVKESFYSVIDVLNGTAIGDNALDDFIDLLKSHIRDEDLLEFIESGALASFRLNERGYYLVELET